MDKVTIAVAKGRLGEEAVANLVGTPLEIRKSTDSRRLFFRNPSGEVTFLFVKPRDTVTYVERGIADAGIVGKDIVLEEDKDVYEVLDLKLGECKFVIAGLKPSLFLEKERTLRIATSYPHYTQAVFAAREQKVEIIKLAGSVELAPLTGLSDLIVDLVETGRTLAVNGLVILEELDAVSGRLIMNKASYRFKYDALRQIEKLLEERIRC